MGVIGLLYLLFRIKRNNFTKKIDHFPGPKSYPLFGNLLELNFEPGRDKKLCIISSVHKLYFRRNVFTSKKIRREIQEDLSNMGCAHWIRQYNYPRRH